MSAPELVRSPQQPADLLLRDVCVLDPRGGLDARHDLLVRGGEIVELGDPGTLTADVELEVLDGGGRLRLLPAFFDPHVHLRSPGQEHKEDIESGTRAVRGRRVRGGDRNAEHRAPHRLPGAAARRARDRGARQAQVPVGFLPAITQGLGGEQLTDMAALRELGALGFTDDGQPVASAGVLRAALRLQRAPGAAEGAPGACGGGVLTLHEEDRTLSRGASMHEGTVSAALGIPGF